MESTGADRLAAQAQQGRVKCQRGGSRLNGGCEERTDQCDNIQRAHPRNCPPSESSMRLGRKRTLKRAHTLELLQYSPSIHSRLAFPTRDDCERSTKITRSCCCLSFLLFCSGCLFVCLSVL